MASPAMVVGMGKWEYAPELGYPARPKVLRGSRAAVSRHHVYRFSNTEARIILCVELIGGEGEQCIAGAVVSFSMRHAAQ